MIGCVDTRVARRGIDRPRHRPRPCRWERSSLPPAPIAGRLRRLLRANQPEAIQGCGSHISRFTTSQLHNFTTRSVRDGLCLPRWRTRGGRLQRRNRGLCDAIDCHCDRQDLPGGLRRSEPPGDDGRRRQAQEEALEQPHRRLSQDLSALPRIARLALDLDDEDRLRVPGPPARLGVAARPPAREGLATPHGRH